MARQPAGRRDKRIWFERNAGGEDSMGTVGTEDWQTLCDRLASVLYGTSAERREAAQEGAVQTATFRVMADSATRAVLVTDRIRFDGFNWDITGIAPIGGPAPYEIEFTAMTKRG